MRPLGYQPLFVDSYRLRVKRNPSFPLIRCRVSAYQCLSLAFNLDMNPTVQRSPLVRTIYTCVKTHTNTLDEFMLVILAFYCESIPGSLGFKFEVQLIAL